MNDEYINKFIQKALYGVLILFIIFAIWIYGVEDLYIPMVSISIHLCMDQQLPPNFMLQIQREEEFNPFINFFNKLIKPWTVGYLVLFLILLSCLIFR